MTNFRIHWLFVAVMLLAGCGGQPGTTGTGRPGDAGQERPRHPGTKVATSLPPDRSAELAAIEGRLAAVKDLDAAGFAEKYAVPFSSALGYDPLTAQGLSLVQGSSLALDDQERALLQKNGFVISARQRFPTFVYGYQTIYLEDLPVYVSADSILYAVHKSYDSMLESLEQLVLIPDLRNMLDSMRGALSSGAASDLPAAARADADVYLAVAGSLLAGSFEPPAAGGDPTLAHKLYDSAVAEAGWQTVILFDVARDIDFSQFKPRGHYTDTEELGRYFRAMMWLGRIDFRILETQPDHTQVFNRRQLEDAYVLRDLMGPQAVAEWKGIDATITAFVGEHDNMVPPELDSLLKDLGLHAAAELAGVDDQTIAQAVVSGGYGTQRIASHIMIDGLGSGTMPLSSTFLLFGQRYTVDSHVFSNVVYDRVGGGTVMRMMPDPLDVSFAALGNDQAGQLLAPELHKYDYAPDLASMRVLVDAHPAGFWHENLYNLWLSALRSLSPSNDVADPASAGLPAVAGTEAWGRRLLDAQHASWAELRHDTILYAKQSYTDGAACDYPDAYVDPYPDFYARIAELASHGAALVDALDFGKSSFLKQGFDDYFANAQNVALTLRAMAEEQRSGAPHSAEHIAFINQAVSVLGGCDGPSGFDGWYAKLFYNQSSAVKQDPTIADVHTQPTDAAGNPVGRVLHVGTGLPRLMVVTVNGCSGPRAYAGLASSYFEEVTSDFKRLDDQDWASQLTSQPPPDVSWVQPIVAH